MKNHLQEYYLARQSHPIHNKLTFKAAMANLILLAVTGDNDSLFSPDNGSAWAS